MKVCKTTALFAVLVLAVSVLSACGETPEKDNSLAVNSSVNSIESAPSSEDKTSEEQSEFTNLNSFTAKTLDGKEYTSENFSEADVTVINIWSTSCGPCINEMPDIAKFAETLPDNVKLITWCLDGSYDASYAESILTSSGYKGITLITGDGDMEKLDSEIMYTPTTLFFDSKGNIIGDALIGGSDDLAAVYTEKINAALKALGKEELK